MGDLIEREAVLEHYRVTDPAGTFAYCSSILDFVQGLPPAQQWIPCDERLPEVDADGESDYILLSFSNLNLPCIGRYEEDEEGGAFYNGDDDRPLTTFGLFVNAWMPLPEPYREDES